MEQGKCIEIDSPIGVDYKNGEGTGKISISIHQSVSIVKMEKEQDGE